MTAALINLSTGDTESKTTKRALFKSGISFSQARNTPHTHFPDQHDAHVFHGLFACADTEITIDYNYVDKDANHPCRGPFHRPSHWQHVPVGATYKCKNGREIVVRAPMKGEDPLYAGAFVPCESGCAVHTPMEAWIKKHLR